VTDRARWLLFLLAIGAATCGRQPSNPGPRSSPTTSTKVEHLFPAEGDVAGRIERLETDFYELEHRVFELEDSDATVTTEEPTFGIAKTQFGASEEVGRGKP